MATILLSLLLSTPTTTASNPTNGRESSYTPCPQVPTLFCRNGSTCISGVAKFSSVDLSNLKHLQTHEEGYHCDCLPGYIGHECEIEVSACGATEKEEGYDPTSVSISRCYHGSTCQRQSDRHYCDCESINSLASSTGTKYAGLMCEHEATSMCAVRLVEEYAPNGQFCTNHGKCVKLVSGSDPHPGCVCREGWSGDRCELKIGEDGSIPKLMGGEDGGSSAGKWVLFSMLIVVMLAVGGAVVAMLIKIQREQASSSKKQLGKTPAEVGLGDVEPDGSGTLGQQDIAEDGVGDLEMKESSTADDDVKDAEGDAEAPMADEDRSDSPTLSEKDDSFVIT